MNIKKWLTFGIPGALALALITTVLTPELRTKIQNSFASNGHEVLATAEGELLQNGELAKVIKYKTSEGLFVEVLKIEANGETSLVDRILLPDKHDGLFNFQGHVTRLAISDIDGDGKLELIAPSFDNQLVPHLNVFKFNPTTGKFELFQAPK